MFYRYLNQLFLQSYIFQYYVKSDLNLDTSDN